MIVIATSYHEARNILLSTSRSMPGELPFFDRVIGIGPDKIDTGALGILSYHVRGPVERPLEVRRVLTVEGSILIYCPDGTSRAPGYAVALCARETCKRWWELGSIENAAKAAVEMAASGCPYGSAPHLGVVAEADLQLGYEGKLTEAVKSGW